MVADPLCLLVELRLGEHMAQAEQDAQADIEAMKRLAAADGSALKELIERHKHGVINIAYRYIGDQFAAEDIAQEAFIRVYQARKRYEPTAKFSTWLYRIVTNLCLSYLRKWQHARTFSLDETYDPSEEGPRNLEADTLSSPPGQRIEREELASVVRQAVHELPENQRMAVILNRYSGLDYHEIAEVMHLSYMAVKSLLNRARNNLKEKLSTYIEDGNIRLKKRR